MCNLKYLQSVVLVIDGVRLSREYAVGSNVSNARGNSPLILWRNINEECTLNLCHRRAALKLISLDGLLAGEMEDLSF